MNGVNVTFIPLSLPIVYVLCAEPVEPVPLAVEVKYSDVTFST